MIELITVAVYLIIAAYMVGSWTESSYSNAGVVPLNVRLTFVFMALLWPLTVGWYIGTKIYNRISNR